MSAEVIAKTAAPYASIIKDILKGIKDEFIDLLEIGLSEYIIDIENKISNTNTFINRQDKVDFYSTYFPLSLIFKGDKIESDNLYAKLFKKNNCAAILGGAGSGKTMLIKHCFLQCYQQARRIPIFVELRDLNNMGISLFDYIQYKILKSHVKPSARTLENALLNGSFVFLLDGFDEIKIELKEKFST